ncbi:hypothetical protein SynMVIR181_01454 [Synechococcus sp. MVIR-18-1]|nr:hypothetical protein SynMVIR181_01454 [Synechococcus sp. MVIR-18-1]
MVPLNLALKCGHRRVDSSKLTLKPIAPETEHLQLALLVMTPPMTGGLT